CFFLALPIVLSGDAQASIVQLVVPVHGQLVFPQGGFLLDKIDTYMGEMQILLDRRPEMQNLQFPLWNVEGDRLVLAMARSHSTILYPATGSTQVVETFPTYTSDHIFYPAGWSNDGTNILYYSVILESFFDRTSSFHLMDSTTGSLTQIGMTYEMGQSVPSDFPLPAGINQALFINFTNVLRNPTYDQWVLLQLEAVNAELTSDIANAPPEARLRINVLWNFTTGQMLSLDSIFPEVIYPQ